MKEEANYGLQTVLTSDPISIQLANLSCGEVHSLISFAHFQQHGPSLSVQSETVGAK